jgi:hypothetical protein
VAIVTGETPVPLVPLAKLTVVSGNIDTACNIAKRQALAKSSHVEKNQHAHQSRDRRPKYR